MKIINKTVEKRLQKGKLYDRLSKKLRTVTEKGLLSERIFTFVDGRGDTNKEVFL